MLRQQTMYGHQLAPFVDRRLVLPARFVRERERLERAATKKGGRVTDLMTDDRF